jgi:hypothetical protein
MPDIRPYRVLTPIQAAHFRDQTAGLQHRLDPVLVRGGPYKDRYVLPARVLADPNHADKLMAMTMLTEAAIDNETAFPPEPEE